ncbi:MAG: energy transducer TonB, partial [Gammaproteobacteria bacterium]|nr:energy transducer TonB [Gammaproteobacteria bacterium]
PEASLPPEVMSEPGPEVANTAALGLGEATDAAALLPSTVLISEQSEAAARTEERVDVDLAAPPETPQATDFATAVTAEAVDLELAPIAPIPEAPPSEPGAVGAIGTPLESGPQPIPELAAVAPRDTVTARAVTPRLRQRDVDIRGVVADYAALLKAWVGRHMSYPVHARLNGVEGTAVVRLVMSRDGRVLSYQLERTSGHVELDQEAIRTIKRASPFPPLPPEMTQIELKLRLPLVFSVKNYEARRTVPPIYLE